MFEKVHTLEEAKDRLNSQLFLLDQQQKQGKYKLEDVGDLLPVGLLINNKEGINKYMNAYSMNYTNFSKSDLEVVGREYQHLIWYDQNDFDEIKNRIKACYERNDESEILSYFMRLKPYKKDEYRWTYVTSKIIKPADETENAEDRILVACPINFMGDMGKKISNLLEENYYLKNNYKRFALLTKREKEIIGLLYQGYNNPQIAEKLFISRHTVEQHRKNIKRKLEIKTVVEMIKFAEVFDLHE
jgi:DNA-binding CsgD family transcriptional regulator